VERKKLVFILLTMSIIVFILVFLYSSSGTTSSENKYCVMGAGFKAPGIDLISDYILLKCDCQGDVKHGSLGVDCLDCDYYTCNSEVKQTCYLLTQEFDFFNYTHNSAYLEEFGVIIPCPPNKWQS
jgi:hypothetical protein